MWPHADPSHQADAAHASRIVLAGMRPGTGCPRGLEWAVEEIPCGGRVWHPKSMKIGRVSIAEMLSSCLQS